MGKVAQCLWVKLCQDLVRGAEDLLSKQWPVNSQMAETNRRTCVCFVSHA